MTLEDYQIQTTVPVGQFSHLHLNSIINYYSECGLDCPSSLEKQVTSDIVKEELKAFGKDVEITPHPFGCADNKLIFSNQGGYVQITLLPNNEPYQRGLEAAKKFKDLLLNNKLFIL